MAEATVADNLNGNYPGLDYSEWPTHPYDLACALCADDNGNISSVAPFLRPYVADDVTPEGWLKRPCSVFMTPLSLVRFYIAGDIRAPIPWRGTGCRPSAIKEAFEQKWAEQEAKERALIDTQCFLYFIGSEEGPIKIGISANPKKRLKQLQTSNPHKLDILAVLPNASLRESVYHDRFAAHRLEGEWFDRHPDILAEIARLDGEAAHG